MVEDASSATGEAVPGAANAEPSKEDARLRLAVATAVQLVDGCEHASITVVEDEALRVRAATEEVAERADRLQHELGEGPGLDAVRTRSTVVSHDLAEDERWPSWRAGAATDLGLACAVSLWVEAEQSFQGTLNLYGTRPHALTPDALATAAAIAERLGVAVLAGRESDELNAVGTRTVIGQAEGILMERLGIDAAEAFALLREAAERTGTKVAQVAVQLVRTRELPGGPADR